MAPKERQSRSMRRASRAQSLRLLASSYCRLFSAPTEFLLVRVSKVCPASAIAPNPRFAEKNQTGPPSYTVNSDNIPANSVPVISAQHELTNPGTLFRSTWTSHLTWEVASVLGVAMFVADQR